MGNCVFRNDKQNKKQEQLDLLEDGDNNLLADEDNQNKITWIDLLHGEGLNLWKYRQIALQNSQNDAINNIYNETKINSVNNDNDNDESNGLVYLQCWNNKNKEKKVCMVKNMNIFKEMESKHNMCKFPNDKNNKAITNTKGKEWERQRRIIMDVMYGILDKSKQYANMVSFDYIITNNNNEIEESHYDTIIDLKNVSLKAAQKWMICLFAGYFDQQLANLFLNHFFAIRACKKEKNRTKMDETRNKFASYLLNYKYNQYNKHNGLLKSFFESSLNEIEIVDNCVNAMAAAFETTHCCIFWTLWNLNISCNNNDAINIDNDKIEQIKQYRNKLQFNKENKNEMNETDFKLLHKIKKESIKGNYVTLNGLSYVGRALIETVRVYPPVWSLSRTCGTYPHMCNNVISNKWDILCGNNALYRDWNVNITDRQIKITSWGVGKRTCPYGTTALFAAYVILNKFIQTFDEWEECKVNNVIHTAYLAPTLNMEGKQLFKVKFNKKYLENVSI
eukprot:195980_1